MKRFLPAFLVATALVAGTANAAGAGSASYSFEIRGFVPVICRASLDATVVPSASGEVSLGQLNEFCNSANGYQVYVDSSPELADATLLVDGKAIALSGNGSTMIASSNAPGMVSRNLVLSSNGAAGTISIRVVAL